eukprot:m.411823 g.411823  ORF g.411823 m.411823 type:complete len:303 (-) comp28745_c0_seq1:155-1063(-)
MSALFCCSFTAEDETSGAGEEMVLECIDEGTTPPWFTIVKCGGNSFGHGQKLAEAGGVTGQTWVMTPAIAAIAAPEVVHYKQKQRGGQPFAVVNVMNHKVYKSDQPGHAKSSILVYNYLTGAALQLPREYKNERIVRSMVRAGVVIGMMFDMGDHNCFIVAKLVFYDSYDKADGSSVDFVYRRPTIVWECKCTTAEAANDVWTDLFRVGGDEAEGIDAVEVVRDQVMGIPVKDSPGKWLRKKMKDGEDTDVECKTFGSLWWLKDITETVSPCYDDSGNIRYVDDRDSDIAKAKVNIAKAMVA